MLVTILSGFLGSGKTTLLRRLLRHAGDARIGVVVNDMSGLEVDADLVRGGHRVSEKMKTLVSLHSGSISGTQKDAFAGVLDLWSTRSDLDHLVVETSGSTHPWALIEAVSQRPAYVLDTFVTLLDARAFVEDYGTGKRLFERLVSNEERQTRSTENLLAEQIQFASVILLTKTDRVPAEDLPCILKCLEVLNPQAEVLTVTYGNISPDRLLGTGGFSLEKARFIARSLLDTSEVTIGDSSAYDIGSTVICDPRPFHPRRLWDLFHHRLGQGIHRSKGFIWLASRDDQVLLWNQAAGSLDLELLAYWKAAVAKDPLGNLLPEEVSELQKRLAGSHPQFGDRLNELTVIGTARDRELFVRELQACFCTGAEIQRWLSGGTFEDPWPKELRKLR